MRSNLSSEMQRKKKNATLLQVALHFSVPALKCIRLRVQCHKSTLTLIALGWISFLRKCLDFTENNGENATFENFRSKAAFFALFSNNFSSYSRVTNSGFRVTNRGLRVTNNPLRVANRVCV